MSKESEKKERKEARKAAKAAEQAISEAEAWKSSSKTVLGRLTCHLKDLPALQIACVEFWYQNSPDDYGRVYSRKHQEPAWNELLKDAFLEYADIAAINKKPVGRKHQCHLILPSKSVRTIRLERHRLQDTKYPGNKELGLPERPMECRVTSVSMLTSTDDKDHELYYKSLNLLIQQRHATPSSQSGHFRRANEFFQAIPRGSSIEGEESLLMSEKNPITSVGNGSTVAVGNGSTALVGNGAAPPAETESITPLVKGCPIRKSSVSHIPPSGSGVQQNRESPYLLRIRTHLSVDSKEKVLRLVFDLTCTAPTTYDNVYEVLLDIFGESINNDDVGRLQPIISDLLVGLEVKRNYKATKSKTTRASKNTWKNSFPIREVVFNKDIKVPVESNVEHNAEGEIEHKSPDVYEYFKIHYNNNKEIEHQHLPLVGDGRGSYFPLTKVRFPSPTQVFPRTASILAQPLQTKIHELRLLESDGPKFMEDIGDLVWKDLIKERTYSREATDFEPNKLLEKFGDDLIERSDPLNLSL